MNAQTTTASEFSVLKRMVTNRFRKDSERGAKVHIIENFLPEDEFEALKSIAKEEKDNLYRKNSGMRSGAAMSSQDLRSGACIQLAESLINDRTLEMAREALELPELQFIGREDTNQLSLLYYGEPGDGIDWHFDGNIYLGDRWAGIFTLQEDTLDEHSKLELRQDGSVRQFPTKLMPNSLALFQGDKMIHRVRGMNEGEERMVVNLLFATNPEPSKNPLLQLYQSTVNYFFYGKARP